MQWLVENSMTAFRRLTIPESQTSEQRIPMLHQRPASAEHLEVRWQVSPKQRNKWVS